MKHRSLGKMFLWFVLSLGLYRLVWLAKTRNEMVSKGQSIPSIWLLFSPYIALLAVIIWMIAATINAPSSSDAPIAPLIAFYAVLLALAPVTLLWFWPYSKAIERVTNEKVSFPLAIIAFFVIPDGIDMLVVQDGFNKLPEQGQEQMQGGEQSPPSPLQV